MSFRQAFTVFAVLVLCCAPALRAQECQRVVRVYLDVSGSMTAGGENSPYAKALAALETTLTTEVLASEDLVQLVLFSDRILRDKTRSIRNVDDLWHDHSVRNPSLFASDKRRHTDLRAPLDHLQKELRDPGAFGPQSIILVSDFDQDSRGETEQLSLRTYLDASLFNLLPLFFQKNRVLLVSTDPLVKNESGPVAEAIKAPAHSIASIEEIHVAAKRLLQIPLQAHVRYSTDDSAEIFLENPDCQGTPLFQAKAVCGRHPDEVLLINETISLGSQEQKLLTTVAAGQCTTGLITISVSAGTVEPSQIPIRIPAPSVIASFWQWRPTASPFVEDKVRFYLAAQDLSPGIDYTMGLKTGPGGKIEVPVRLNQSHIEAESKLYHVDVPISTLPGLHPGTAVDITLKRSPFPNEERATATSPSQSVAVSVNRKNVPSLLIFSLLTLVMMAICPFLPRYTQNVIAAGGGLQGLREPLAVVGSAALALTVNLLHWGASNLLVFLLAMTIIAYHLPQWILYLMLYSRHSSQPEAGGHLFSTWNRRPWIKMFSTIITGSLVLFFLHDYIPDPFPRVYSLGDSVELEQSRTSATGEFAGRARP